MITADKSYKIQNNFRKVPERLKLFARSQQFNMM